jgi:hypothetical protein
MAGKKKQVKPAPKKQAKKSLKPSKKLDETKPIITPPAEL